MLKVIPVIFILTLLAWVKLPSEKPVIINKDISPAFTIDEPMFYIVEIPLLCNT
jgi:hypothetical protein